MIEVSVVVPIYNVEKYLGRCLESLVNQTFQKIEIICVNDGSPDQSQKIVDEYYKKYPHLIKSLIKPTQSLSAVKFTATSCVNVDKSLVCSYCI